LRLRGAAESAADAVRVDVLDPPSRPSSPASPNKPLLVIAVLIAGIGGGIATAFVLSQVQATYATSSRLARASGLPVLGSVTEIVSDDLQQERRQRMRHFIWAGGALAGLSALLLVVETVSSGMLG